MICHDGLLRFMRRAIAAPALMALFTLATADEPAAPASAPDAAAAPASGSSPAPADAAAQPAADGPRIIFAEKEHNFGVLQNDAVVSHNFKFNNIGNAKLVIENVKTGCGCTSTVIGEKEIAPGGSGQIEVKFNSHGKKGHQRQNVQVMTNDPVSPTTNLVIQLDVKRDLAVKPMSIYMGNMTEGETKSQDVTITAAADTTNITSVESSSPSLTYKLSEPKKNAAGEKEWTLTATLVAGKASQAMQRETLNVHTNSAGMAKLEIPIQARVAGDVSLSPTLLNFGTIKPGGVLTRDARLMTKAEKPIEIERIETNDLPIKVTVTDEMEGKIKKIDAELTAPALPNPIRGNIDIYVKGQAEAIKLYVMATVRTETSSVPAPPQLPGAAPAPAKANVSQ